MGMTDKQFDFFVQSVADGIWESDNVLEAYKKFVKYAHNAGVKIELPSDYPSDDRESSK